MNRWTNDGSSLKTLGLAGMLSLLAWAVPVAGEQLPAAPADVPGVDPAAYLRLLEENQSLQRRVQELNRRTETLTEARAVLTAQSERLEQQRAEMAALLTDFRERTAVATAETAALRRQLDAAQQQRDRAVQDLRRLREREQRLLAGMEAAESPETGRDTVSDLVRDRDREIARLREELDEARAETAETARLQRQRDEAVNLLDGAMARMADERRTAERERRAMAGAVERLRDELQEREVMIERLEQNVARLRRERNDRLVAAAAGADAGEIPPAAVLEADEVERERLTPAERRRRDLHYNSGVLYARTGRWREAEREYLAALESDPLDAATHYNLGILYHEHLSDPAGAIRHYRAYLERAPHGPNAAAVRSWAMALEMER